MKKPAGREARWPAGWMERRGVGAGDGRTDVVGVGGVRRMQNSFNGFNKGASHPFSESRVKMQGFVSDQPRCDKASSGVFCYHF